MEVLSVVVIHTEPIIQDGANDIKENIQIHIEKGSAILTVADDDTFLTLSGPGICCERPALLNLASCIV